MLEKSVLDEDVAELYEKIIHQTLVFVHFHRFFVLGAPVKEDFGVGKEEVGLDLVEACI